MPKPSDPLVPKKPGGLDVDPKTGMPLRKPAFGVPSPAQAGKKPAKPAGPAIPIRPGAPAVPIQKVEPPKAPPVPVKKTIPFTMDEFFSIIGKNEGDFDSLPPVAAIRTRQKYGRSLISSKPTPEALQKAWDALEALEGRKEGQTEHEAQVLAGKKAGEFVDEARKLLAAQKKPEALKSLELALTIEPASLQNLKTAGDLARTTGDLKKASLYYTLVSRFTRADSTTIDPKDAEAVEAAKQALEGMK